MEKKTSRRLAWCLAAVLATAAVAGLAWLRLREPALEPGAQVLQDCVSAMEEIDDLSRVFAAFPAYRATPAARAFLKEFLRSDPYARVAAMEREELE